MEIVELGNTLALVERGIGDRPDHGLLPHDSVQALDVLYHALVFTGVSDALSTWRTALWERTLTDQGRTAVAGMLNYLNGEVQAGRDESVSGVCDCLTALFSATSGTQRASDAQAGGH
jgi:hypothetical protein